MKKKSQPSAPALSNTVEGQSLNHRELNSASNHVHDTLREFFASNEEIESNLILNFRDAFASSMQRSKVMAELLAFWVADEEYAIDITKIQEIIKVPELTHVPRAPRGVLGIISLRGTIVPVVDLRVILRLEEIPITSVSRILVLRSDDDILGLLVDRVSSVVRLDRESIEPVPTSMQREGGDFLQGVGREDDRMLIVLDLLLLLNSMETCT